MTQNSSAPKTLYLGLDVHKAETVIAILESDRDSEPRHYGSIATTQHALERAMRRIAKSQDRQIERPARLLRSEWMRFLDRASPSPNGHPL